MSDAVLEGATSGPKQLSATQRALLNHVWTVFRSTGDWPRARKLEVELDDALDREGGLEAVCTALGRTHILCEDLVSPEARVKLRIRGIALCERGQAEVDAFLLLLRYAGVQYAIDPDATITVDAFIAATKTDESLARRAFKYAMIDGGRFWRGGSVQGLTLDRFARRLATVETLDDLDEKIRLDAPTPVTSWPGEATETLAAAGPRSEDEDAVTSLPSRKALNAAFPRLVADAESSGLPFSLVMADIDHFKAVNDDNGHPKGDEVLQAVHACMQMVTRGKGGAYRYGGEEFAITLPNHTMDEAVAVAERLRREIEGNQPGGLPVTASFGVATFPAHAQTLDELVKAADDALYDAKKSGRNAVRAPVDSLAAQGAAIVSTKRRAKLAASLSISSKAEQVAPDRHEYVLEVHAENTGTAPLRDWTIQVQLPRVIVPASATSFRVDARRDTAHATFRVTQEEHSGKPIFPDDHVKVFNLHFVMNDALHERGRGLFELPVTAVLFAGDEVVAEAERPFGELQQY